MRKVERETLQLRGEVVTTVGLHRPVSFARTPDYGGLCQANTEEKEKQHSNTNK